jgi:hypothetical protein
LYFSNAIFTVPPFHNAPKKQKTRWAFCASGPMSALFSESLYAPQQTRRRAMMMMVPVRLRSERDVHVRKINDKESSAACQCIVSATEWHIRLSIGRMKH